MKSVSQYVLGIIAAAGIAVAGAASAAEHNHSHEAHGAPEPTLNQGKKWPTDAALRKGMGTIRAAMAGSLRPIHEGTLSADKYQSLATTVEGEVGYIVANCKLDEKADAQLHAVLAQLGEGVDAMKGAQQPEQRRAGAVKAVEALNSYGRYFDHPGWKPLKD